MGKVVASTFVSIDNLMVGENEDMSWVVDNFDAEMGNDMGQLLASMQAILLGRVTYEIMANHWPTRTEAEDPGADQMNATPKIVFSKTLEKAPWGKWDNAKAAKEIVPEKIQQLKRQSDKNLVIMGSASVVQQFTNLGLIDEYRLWLHPVILGRGKPLFRNIKGRRTLKLIKAITYQNGVMALTLQPDE
jgi:dihydrofolate reductase